MTSRYVNTGDGWLEALVSSVLCLQEEFSVLFRSHHLVKLPLLKPINHFTGQFYTVALYYSVEMLDYYAVVLCTLTAVVL